MPAARDATAELELGPGSQGPVRGGDVDDIEGRAGPAFRLRVDETGEVEPRPRRGEDHSPGGSRQCLELIGHLQPTGAERHGGHDRRRYAAFSGWRPVSGDEISVACCTPGVLKQTSETKHSPIVGFPQA